MNKIIIDKYQAKKHKNIAKRLCERIRDIDVIECKEMGETDIKKAVMGGVEEKDYDNYIAFYEDGTPICVFGVSTVPIIGDMHGIWLLGSKEMETSLHIQKTFLKESKTIITKWKEQYPALCNFVHKENAAAIRWLTWLGARFYETDNEQMFAFVIGKE